MMAAVRLDRELKNPIICHCVCPTIPDRKGKKLGRENTLIRKKAASKQSFGFVSGRKLGVFKLTMKENPRQGTR